MLFVVVVVVVVVVVAAVIVYLVSRTHCNSTSNCNLKHEVVHSVTKQGPSVP